MTTRLTPAVSSLTALLLVGATVAQSTWVVDESQGPGTHFSDLPPALAAANHGDVILVRAGTYLPATTSKGLAILGAPGALLRANTAAPMVVTGLPAGTNFVMKGISAVPDTTGGFMRCTDNAGRIQLEELALEAIVGQSSHAAAALDVQRCSEVAINGCRLFGGPGLLVAGSQVLVSDCTVTGTPAPPEFPFAFAHAGIETDGTVLTVSRGTIRGGDGRYVPSPALLLVRSRVVLAGDAATRFQAGTGGITTNGAIQAIDSAVQRDPSITLSNPPISGSGGSMIVQRIPSLRSRGVPLGGTIAAELYSPRDDLVLLFESLPGNPIDTPFGLLWLDPAGLLLLDVGVQGPGEHRTTLIPVPLDPSLRGLAFTQQALSGPGASLTLSTPVVVVIH